jgi:hypothetical protein
MRRRVREIALSTVPWRTRTPTPHGAGEGSRTERRRGLFCVPRPWSLRDPDRPRGRRPREANLPEVATHRSAPPGDPRTSPAAFGPAGQGQASPQRSRTLRRPIRPGWRAPTGGARCFQGNPGVSPGILLISATVPKDRPSNPRPPLEPRRPPPCPEGRGGIPKVPEASGRLETPERASRPTGPPLPHRAEGGVHRKAKGWDARQSPSGPTVWDMARGRPTEPAPRPPKWTRRPRRTAILPEEIRSPREPPPRVPAPLRSDTASGRSPSRHPPSRAARASPVTRRFRVPAQSCRAADCGQD